MYFSQRLSRLSANVFADMDRAKAQAVATGQTLIDLSLGSSDLPASPVAIQAIHQALDCPETHGYVLHRNTQDFRERSPFGTKIVTVYPLTPPQKYSH